jgi:type IV pilus assembly protein PilM
MAASVGIGVDIGEDEIRVVKLRRMADGISLQAMGSHPTPKSAVTGGTVTDPRALAEGLRAAFRRYDVRGSWAAVGLPGRAAASRVIELPVMERKELTAVVAGEMEHYRMIPMNQGTFDFIPLGEPSDENRHVPILVMAADKKVVDSYREALRLAGMQMAALEPVSLAASRAVFPALGGGGVALLTIGARTSELTIFHEGALRYLRQIDVGALEFTGESTGGAGEAGPAGAPDSLSGTELPRLDRAGGSRESLVSEVQRSLGFYHREAPSAARVERLVVCLDPERVRDLPEYLETSLGMPVRLGEPFKGVVYSDTRFNPDLLARVAPAYGPAMGLALRMMGEMPGAPQMDLSITGIESKMAKIAPKWLIYALTGCVLLVLAVLTGVLFVNRAVQKRQVELGAAKQELVQVSKEEQERTSAAKRVQEAQRIVQMRGLPWSDILFQVSDSMPQQVWLTGLNADAGNTLELDGVAASAASVATLMESLTRSPLFSGPQMTSITKDSARERSVVRYQVQVVLTPPAQSQGAALTVSAAAAALPPGGAGTGSAQ